MKNALFIALMLLMSSAAHAVNFSSDTSHFDLSNNGNSLNSVSIQTPTVLDNSFVLGETVDTSGKGDVDASGTFNRVNSDNNLGNGSVAVTGGSNGGAQSVPEAGTLILLSAGILGLIGARENLK